MEIIFISHIKILQLKSRHFGYPLTHLTMVNRYKNHLNHLSYSRILSHTCRHSKIVKIGRYFATLWWITWRCPKYSARGLAISLHPQHIHNKNNLLYQNASISFIGWRTLWWASLTQSLPIQGTAVISGIGTGILN